MHSSNIDNHGFQPHNQLRFNHLFASQSPGGMSDGQTVTNKGSIKGFNLT